MATLCGMKKTPAQRQADVRARRAALGLKQCLVYAPVAAHPAIKALAAQLRSEAKQIPAKSAD